MTIEHKTVEMAPFRAVSIPHNIWSSFMNWVVCSGGYLQVVESSPIQGRRFILTQRDPDMARVDLRLTRRELQVLQGMQRGRSNSEIGLELFLSRDTVKTHASRLFKKLEVNDRARAVAVGYELGLLGGDT